MVINSYILNIYLTKKFFKYLFEFLLSLHSSNLQDEGLKVLFYSMVNLKHFRSLDIGDCQLTDNSIIFIRELIHRREHTKGISIKLCYVSVKFFFISNSI